MSVRFQADPGEAGGGPPAPEPAPGPAPEPYPEPDAPVAEPALEAAPAPPGLSWDSPELLDLVDARAQQQLAQLAPLFEQALANEGVAPDVPAAGPALDPLSDNFGQDLQALLAAEREATLGEIRQMFGTLQEREQARETAENNARGEQHLADVLDDNIARLGDFPADPETGFSAKTLVRPLADALFPVVAAKLGYTQRAADIAMEQAAQMVRDTVAVGARQGVNRETTRLTAIAGARGEPGAAGAGGIPTRPEPRTPGEVTARYAAEARRLHSEGHV
jgi:hypothetical protein